MSKFNIYEEITNRIIEQLESGKIPWAKPWSGVVGGAYNRVS
jgi:antirestriction protein ArdC